MNLKNHFGLDIGSTQIKLVQLSNSGDKIRLEAIASAPFNIEVNFSQMSVDLDPLVNAIKNLVKMSGVGTKNVNIALPESQVYTRVIGMPVMNDSDLNQAIKFQLEQYVPLQASDVTEKHSVISRPVKGTETENNTEMEVLLVAVPNFLVERYSQLIERCGLTLAAIDTEILCASRSLVGANAHSPATLLVNLGAKGTDLAVVKHGDLVATRSISTGGTAISRAVASELNLDMVQAEEYKKSYGLSQDKLSGSVARAILPIMDMILTEIKRIVSNLESTRPNDVPKRLVLTGGTAFLPGLVNYFVSQLSLEVEVGNPFSQIQLTPEQEKYVGETGLIYTNAVGLALKEV